MSLALLSVAACVDKLPEQDRRILNATAVAKMPVEDLAAEYQANAAAADRKYFGKAVEVSGKATDVRQAGTDTTLVFTDKTGADIAHALMLDDQAKEVVAGLGADRRVRLKCYADRLAGHVMLRSCVKP